MKRPGSLSWVPVLLLGSFGLAAADTDQPGWLSVADCGASGSPYQTTAATTADSAQITVTEVGDFQVGQCVTVSKCNPHFEHCILKPPENPYSTAPLGDAADHRGYDGTSGSWLIFLGEVNRAEPLTFRWSDDLARTWKGTDVPVTFDWQPLSGGVEIKFKKQAWQPGHMITFHARDQWRWATSAPRIATRPTPTSAPASTSLPTTCSRAMCPTAAARFGPPRGPRR